MTNWIGEMFENPFKVTWWKVTIFYFLWVITFPFRVIFRSKKSEDYIRHEEFDIEFPESYE